MLNLVHKRPNQNVFDIAIFSVDFMLDLQFFKLYQKKQQLMCKWHTEGHSALQVQQSCCYGKSATCDPRDQNKENGRCLTCCFINSESAVVLEDEMAALQLSSLPSVLKQYVPNSERPNDL